MATAKRLKTTVYIEPFLKSPIKSIAKVIGLCMSNVKHKCLTLLLRRQYKIINFTTRSLPWSL